VVCTYQRRPILARYVATSDLPGVCRYQIGIHTSGHSPRPALSGAFAVHKTKRRQVDCDQPLLVLERAPNTPFPFPLTPRASSILACPESTTYETIPLSPLAWLSRRPLRAQRASVYRATISEIRERVSSQKSLREWKTPLTCASPHHVLDMRRVLGSLYVTWGETVEHIT